MGRNSYHLHESGLGELFEIPPIAVAEPDEPANLSEGKTDPAPNPLLGADGSVIGLGVYSRLVTPAWRWDWPHLRYVDAVLDRVQSGELRFVIIEMPPRHGKTEKATVRHPAYRLELEPTLPIILAAYNDKIAQKFSRKIRRLVRGRIELSREKNAAEDWETTEGGGVRAVGVGTGVAGLPAGLLLIDDPFKSRKDAYSESYRDKVWEWYTEDLYTRLEPGAAIVITMTRRHEDDLVGRILASETASDWTVIRLPALAEADDPLGRAEGEALCPDRYDEEALEKIRRTIGEVSFSGLYQQRPAPAEGHIFKSVWWRFYTTKDHPIIENGHAVPYLPEVWHGHLQSWDMSFKDKQDSNPVSGQFWSWVGANCYFRDREHGAMDFTKSIAAVRRMTAAHPEATLKLVEDKANGPAIISALRATIQGLVAVEPDGDKVARAYAVTPLFEAGNVWFPHPSIAPWILAVILELLHFPFGTTDDDVDALTQALRRLMTLAGERAPAGRDETRYSEAATVANQARY
jgi:predicted phage terminase large subunit-like protein